MSCQYAMTETEVKAIKDVLKNHKIELCYGEDDGVKLFNEVSIVCSAEDGVRFYIQVN